MPRGTNTERFAERFEVVMELAVGGMGEVHLARDLTTGTPVVLKRIRSTHIGNRDYATMFEDEVRIGGGLTHPNIVALLESGEHAGRLWMALEYIDGVTLSQLQAGAMGRRRRLPLGCILAIISDVARGLEYAHTRTDESGTPLGIVHRDLSPANVMVTRQGQAKILDFGVAKAAMKQYVSVSGRVKGTPAYLSPEQIAGQGVDARTDVYVMGTLLYEMTTLRRLFKRNNPLMSMQAILAGSVPRPSQHAEGYPAPLEAVVLKALARHPNARYGSAGELAEALVAVGESLGADLSAKTVAGEVEALLGLDDSEAARPVAQTDDFGATVDETIAD